MTKTDQITDAALAELKALHAGLHCSFGGIGGKIVDSFPSLLARLEAAEREREELRKQNRITQAKLENMAIDCGQAEGQLKRLREDLAARDASMKKLGAIEAYDEMRKQAVEVGKESGLAAKFCKLFAEQCIEAAAQLRREGE